MADRSNDSDELTASTAEPAADASDEEKAAYGFARWAAQRDTYTGLFRIWARAILFLLGRQWLEWNDQEKRFAPEQHVPKWRQRPVTNLVFGVYRAARAKMTKQRPALTVIPPQNGDTDDRQSAAIGNAVLEQTWRTKRLGRLKLRIVGWLLTTGAAYVEADWDAEAGKLIALTVPVLARNELTGEVEERQCPCDEEGDPRVTELGEPDFEAEPIRTFEGDVTYRLVSPLSVRFNPEATSKEDATEWYVGELWPVSRVERELAMKGDDIRIEDEDLEEFEDVIAAHPQADALLGTGSDRREAIGDRALVLKYYRKPSDEYPEGRHWISVNKKPVVAEDDTFEFPLPNGFWPPHVAYDDIDIPGQVHSAALIPQCVSLNREYNSFNGKVSEHNLTMAMGGKWIVAPADRNLKISTDPGQKLISDGYMMNLPPIQAKLQPLPAQVYEERSRILNDLMLVSGLNELALSQRPEGVTSGRAFLVMQEAVDSVLTPTLANMEDADAELGRRTLLLVQRHYTEERTVRIRGTQGAWEIRSFKGADLGDSIDVHVESGSSFPWSKSARQDTAIQLVTGLPGLVTDAASGAVDGQKLSKILDIGGLQAFQVEGDADGIEVEMEHAMFEAYNPDKGVLDLPLPAFYQAHPKHYSLHAELMKRDRPRFDRWHPMAQKAFIDHLLATLQTIQTQVKALTPAPAPGPNGAPGAAPPDAGAPADGAGGPPSPAGDAMGGESDLQLTGADFAAAGQ